MKHSIKHLLLGLLIGILLTPITVQAQWTVFDPAQYSLQIERQIEEANRWLERVRSLSGVESAALADNRVLGGWSWWMKITRPGQEIKASEGSLLAGSTIVGPEYFRTVGIPLLQGRTFTEQDREGSRPVAIINRTLAKRISPSASIVGSLLQLDEEAAPVEVVGVVQDSKYRTLGEEPQPFVYVPLLQRGTLKATLHVRSTSTRPEAVATIVASELRTLDRMLPLLKVQNEPPAAIPIAVIVGSSRAAWWAGEAIHMEQTADMAPMPEFWRRAGPIT